MANVVGGKGKGLGKVPHLAAEEEEESTDDSVNSKFIGGSHISARYRLRDSESQGDTHEEDDPHVHLMDDLQSVAEINSDVPEGWGLGYDLDRPAHAPSPTVLSASESRHPSEESDVPSIPEPTGHTSEPWKDREALSKALVTLAEKS